MTLYKATTRSNDGTVEYHIEYNDSFITIVVGPNRIDFTLEQFSEIVGVVKAWVDGEAMRQRGDIDDV